MLIRGVQKCMERQKCRNVWGNKRETLGNDSRTNSVYGPNSIGSHLVGAASQNVQKIAKNEM